MANIKVNGKRVRELRENTSIGSKKKASLDDIAYLSESSGALRDHKGLKDGEAFPFPILQFTKPWLGFVETKPDQLFDDDRVRSLAYILGASFEEITNTEYANPFKGLKSFGVEDAVYFGGRSSETQQVYDLLLDHHLVGVIGASGSGKSSLVFAGVCPFIQKSQPNWKILSFRVGDKPLENLFYAVDNWLFADERMDKPKRIRAFLDNLNESHDALHFYLTSHSRNNLQTPLLLVDQFEELYTLCRDVGEQEVFLKSLMHAVEQKSVRLLLTVRADFYDRLQTSPHPFFDLLKPGLLDLKPMNDHELCEAAQTPAKQVNLTFDDGLIDHIVRDLGPNKGKLPILQFTLFKLWGARDLISNKIRFSDYEALGGIRGVIQNHANKVVANELNDEERILAKLTLPTLVHLGEYGNDIKIREPLSRYSHEQIEVLRKLSNEDCRLLTIEGVASFNNPNIFIEYVELAHEELIRSWPELGQWLQEDLVHHQLRSRLQSNYNEFVVNEKNSDFLLPEGKPLEDAKQLVRDFADNFLSKDIQEYILNSEMKWAAERRRKSRLKQQSALALITATIFLIISGFAGWFWHQANVSAEAAESAKQLADRTKSRFSAFEAQRLTEQGDHGSALALILANLPSGIDEKIDPIVHDRLLESLFKNSEVASFAVHEGAVTSIAISPDGSFIVAGADDNTARIWTADGEPVKTLTGHEGTVTSIAISPDSSFVVTGADDNSARIWTADGELVKTLTGHEGTVTSVAISPDSSFVVTGADDNTARIWTADGEPVKTLTGHGGTVSSVAISPDSSFIVTGSWDETARIWTADGEPVKTLTGHESIVISVAISPDSSFVVTGADDNTARIWTADGELVKTLTGHEGTVTSVAISPDSSFVVTGADDNTARIWTADGEPVKTLTGHGGTVTSIAISPDSSFIVSGADDNSARIWTADGGLVKTLTGHESTVTSVAISPDSSFIVTGSWDETARIWTADGGPVKTLIGHEDTVSSVAISPDSSFIVTGSWDETARIWTADGEPVKTLTGHEGTVTSIAISADSSFIVTGAGDNTARIWTADGELVKTLTGHDGTVTSVAISPDGSFIVAGADDNTARIWTADGEPVKTLTGHDGTITSVAISPDSSFVVTGADDNTARIWTADGGSVKILIDHQNTVTSVAISPDSSFIVTGSWDDTARIWKIPEWIWLSKQRIISYARRVAPGGLSEKQKILYNLLDE